MLYASTDQLQSLTLICFLENCHLWNVVAKSIKYAKVVFVTLHVLVKIEITLISVCRNMQFFLLQITVNVFMIKQNSLYCSNAK